MENLEQLIKEIKKSLGNRELAGYYTNRYRWVELRRLSRKYAKTPLLDLDIKSLARNREVLPREMEFTYVCFGRYLYDVHYAHRTRTLFYIYTNRSFANGENNFCWWHKDQIEYWIEAAKQEAELDFSYRVEEFKSARLNDRPMWKISLNLTHLTKNQRKFLLFWIRNLYEWPANFCALDAMILKRDYFPEESLINLLTLTTNYSLCNGGVLISFDQNLSLGGKFITSKCLSSRLHNSEYKLVSSVFDSRRSDTTDIYNHNKIFGESIVPFIRRGTHLTANGWVDKAERFDHYVNIYPHFKENEIDRS